jgi:hypothetical protein
VTDVWIANDEGSEIVRARDIAVASLDYNGNVNVRLAGTRALGAPGRTLRGGAAGTVVTVQTAAQAAGVRALMRKPGVTPRAAVGPGSAVLRSIAGPPARRTAPGGQARPPALAATQAAGRGAVAASGGFRGRRGQGRRG